MNFKQWLHTEEGQEELKKLGYRQCAVGQKTTQFCGQLEEAVKRERIRCATICNVVKEELPSWDAKIAAKICALDIMKDPNE
ncbi:hypothetical protein [Microcystis sp. M42BS1]|uniref:hypothetical protein n=1 Tax=Microcystis sp. M42BS1 TaxID=2771192 RepID=UPI0025835C60|nr:hypothetical protein [Microcystis sp. M42BS1]MCA2570666.1 hypothetical protein [Microcystis sp. M42BS1]